MFDCSLADPSSHVIDFKMFVKEAVIMKDFHHDHVLGLRGLAEKEPGVPYVILPYMPNGDLHSYIKNPDKVSPLPCPVLSWKFITFIM